MSSSLLRALRDILFFLVSMFYRNSVKHYTINPLEEIRKHQTDPDRLRLLLPRLKSIKSQESHFLKQASTLSAAAVIGIFSWPSTTNAVWVAKLLWYCSFFFSTFGLISSSTQRMLDILPDDASDGDELSEIEMALFLDLLLTAPKPQSQQAADNDGKKEGNEDLEAGALSPPPPHEFSFSVMWSLQTSMMLMSWSWVLLLLGYALSLLTPFIQRQAQPWTVEHTICVIAIAFGVIALLNYFVSSGLTDARTSCFEETLAQTDGPRYCRRSATRRRVSCS